MKEITYKEFKSLSEQGERVSMSTPTMILGTGRSVTNAYELKDGTVIEETITMGGFIQYLLHTAQDVVEVNELYNKWNQDSGSRWRK